MLFCTQRPLSLKLLTKNTTTTTFQIVLTFFFSIFLPLSFARLRRHNIPPESTYTNARQSFSESTHYFSSHKKNEKVMLDI